MQNELLQLYKSKKNDLHSDLNVDISVQSLIADGIPFHRRGRDTKRELKNEELLAVTCNNLELLILLIKINHLAKRFR